MKLPVDLPVLYLPVHVEAAMGPYFGTTKAKIEQGKTEREAKRDGTAEQTRARKKKAEAGSVHEQCE